MRTRAAVAAVSRMRVPALAGLVAAVGVAVPGVAVAQELGVAPAEVPAGSASSSPNAAGSHRGFSVVEPPAGLPEARNSSPDDGSGRWFFRSWRSVSPSDAARALYDDALKALEAGNTGEAQRLFERLVAEAPNSKFAGEARQHLGRLYRGQAAGAPDPDSPPEPRARAEALPWSGQGGGEARPVSVDSALSPPAPAVSRTKLLEARVSATVDEEFLAHAGDRVFFGTGSADLGIRAQGVIHAQARFLLQRPGLAAVVEGHADDGPLPDAETLRLSEARAEAVRARLIAEGVAAERLTVLGRGREERVADCPTPECLAQNRRAITILLDNRRRASQRPARQLRGASHETDAPAPTQ